jgi:Uma2 family endonuclease
VAEPVTLIDFEAAADERKIHSMSSVAMEIPLRRFTVDEYYRMAESGVFAPDERVELVEGVVYRMSPEGKRHVAAIELASDRFRELLAGRHRIRSQHPLSLSVEAEPEPDVAIVENPDPRAYLDSHPQTALLVIEVSESSLEYDLTVKAKQYSKAGIPEYWVINLVDDVVEVFRSPKPEGYREHVTKRPGERIQPVALEGLFIDVDHLIP